MLISSLVPSNMNLAFTLQFLAAGVPSVSHLLKFSLSRRSLPYVHDSPFDCSLGVLSMMDLVAKEMVWGSVDSLDVWDPYCFPGVTLDVF